MAETDTYEAVKERLEELGIEQLALMQEPCAVQLKNYKTETAYLFYIENGYLNYFDGENFRKVNFQRVKEINRQDA